VPNVKLVGANCTAGVPVGAFTLNVVCAMTPHVLFEAFVV
jgi:hypothetical protein